MSVHALVRAKLPFCAFTHASAFVVEGRGFAHLHHPPVTAPASRARKADGIAAKDLADLLPGKPEARTALLNNMIKEGSLRKEGVGRATSYHLARATSYHLAKPEKEGSAED